MGFMQSYKRLDNLCKDMNGSGVTGYIEDMELKKNGEFCVSGWKADYQSLKHYRYVRNQIAHENYADEGNMCSDSDVVWIENFYQRVMNQTDPLAQYYRTNKSLNESSSAKPQMPRIPPYTPPRENTHRNTQKKFGRGSIFLLTATLVAVTVLLIGFLCFIIK